MKVYEGVVVNMHVFLISHPDPFAPVERASGTHYLGDWVDPRAGLNDMQKFIFFSLSLFFSGT
jgi:hypothetical protein